MSRRQDDSGAQGASPDEPAHLSPPAEVDVDRVVADPADVPPPVDWDEPCDHEVELETIEVTAEVEPGVHIYHWVIPDMDHHISSGMFGAILVEPEDGLPEVDRLRPAPALHEGPGRPLRRGKRSLVEGFRIGSPTTMNTSIVLERRGDDRDGERRTPTL